MPRCPVLDAECAIYGLKRPYMVKRAYSAPVTGTWGFWPLASHWPGMGPPQASGEELQRGRAWPPQLKRTLLNSHPRAPRARKRVRRFPKGTSGHP